MASEKSFGEINKEYWDTQADTVFDQEWIKNLLRQVFENLQSHIDWIGIKQTTATKGTLSQETPVRMLDYACGSGIASRVRKRFPRPADSIENSRLIMTIQALYPYVTEIRGIDVSDSMVELYNKSARSDGVPESQIFAIQGDLAAPLTEASHPALGRSEFFQFDVIVISMALHHIDVPEFLLERLVERLNKGGVVVIIDLALDQEGHQNHQHIEGSHSLKNAHNPAAHTVRHEGFSKEQIYTMLRGAGCSEVDYIELDEPTKVPDEIGGQKQAFFARGKK
ncbi:hypothetical protein MMC07_001110 [Pseudocyphellaria aurata]|nr:hypothetical protein [Pseudocyphellaria aurata]